MRPLRCVSNISRKGDVITITFSWVPLIPHSCTIGTCFFRKEGKNSVCMYCGNIILKAKAYTV